MKTIESSPVSYRHVLVAVAGSTVLAFIALGYLPRADEPWGQEIWFPAIYLACTFLLGGLISLFLALQVLAGAPTRSAAWLSGGYAFTAANALVMFLTSPDILEIRSFRSRRGDADHAGSADAPARPEPAFGRRAFMRIDYRYALCLTWAKVL